MVPTLSVSEAISQSKNMPGMVELRDILVSSQRYRAILLSARRQGVFIARLSLERLSICLCVTKYKTITFAKVDVDKVKSVAQKYKVWELTPSRPLTRLNTCVGGRYAYFLDDQGQTGRWDAQRRRPEGSRRSGNQTRSGKRCFRRRIRIWVW